jgi:hypothetical protein
MKSRRRLYFFVVFLFILTPFIINADIFLNLQIKKAYKEKVEVKGQKTYVYFSYSYKQKSYELILTEDYFFKNSIVVAFNKKRPAEVVIFSLSGLYFNSKMLVSIIMFVFISALFFSLNEIDKKIENDFFE